MGRGRTAAIAALAGTAAVALVGFFLLGSGEEPEGAGVGGESAATSPAADDGRVSSASPFATETGAPAPATDSAVDASADPSSSASSSAPARFTGVQPLQGPVDVDAIGRTDLDDEAFEALAARLAEDPELMAAVVDAFRSESDPARLARLVRLLGEVGGPAPTALAAELVYSADPALRDIGLDLLRRVQPGNAEARDIVSGLLANGTGRETLLPVLQTLTRPGVVPLEERGRLAGQLSLLSSHEDPAVRRLGLDVLSRWSDGGEHVTLMRDGLVDAHPGVREAAAYALVGRSDPDGALTAELFAVADDPNEEERVRRAAILALKNLPLDGADRTRRLAIERGLDTVRAR